MQWDKGRAAALYAGSARRMILSFKHGDKPDMAQALGHWMHRAAGDIIARADMIVPVPLHRRRFLMRRYNQSAELSRVIARLSGKAHRPDILRRVRPTEMQRARNARQRMQNVSGAFIVPARLQGIVRDRHILLVDDVLTTGATLNAATAALRPYRPESVSVAVFARAASSTDF